MRVRKQTQRQETTIIAIYFNIVPSKMKYKNVTHNTHTHAKVAYSNTYVCIICMKIDRHAKSISIL